MGIYFEEETYWSGNGPLQEDHNRLIKLMPAQGPADTVAGEMIRAVSRLGYDFYNNGMGNNTSGALNYLSANDCISYHVFMAIEGYTRGRCYTGNYDGDVLHYSIERMINETVNHILENPELEELKNDEDMFDYQDPDDDICYECGDVIENYSSGDYCEDCAIEINSEDYA